MLLMYVIYAIQVIWLVMIQNCFTSTTSKPTCSCSSLPFTLHVSLPRRKSQLVALQIQDCQRSSQLGVAHLRHAPSQATPAIFSPFWQFPSWITSNIERLSKLEKTGINSNMSNLDNNLTQNTNENCCEGTLQL